MTSPLAESGTSPYFIAAFMVGIVALVLAESNGVPRVMLIFPDFYQLIEQGCFLAGGAMLGSIPATGLMWLARGERGKAKASPRMSFALSTVCFVWCTLTLAIPFVLPSSRGGLGPMSMALMLWVNLWKIMDMCAGTSPPCVFDHPLNLFSHLTFLIEYKTTRARTAAMTRTASELRFMPRTHSEAQQLETLQGASGSSGGGGGSGGSGSVLQEHAETADAPEMPAPGEWAATAFELAKTLTLFFALASASELSPPAWLAAAPKGAFVLEWLAKYSHVWYIYCFLKMACDANSTVLLTLGYKPQVAFRNPLTASTSPTDFWSRRWNLLVRGLFHRTVFTPLRNRSFPAWVSALSAFVVSGAFHEYAFAPASHGAALGSLTVFFCVQAAACTGELLVRRLSTKSRLLQAIDANTPAWARVLLTSALLVPFSPLFMAPLKAHGTLTQMRHVMLRVRLAAA